MKILIVDDHPVFRAGLLALIESESELDVCGEAEDGEQAISQVKKLNPDIVIIDINMPRLNGIEATSQILAIHPNIKVIALSINTGEQIVKDMLNAGAVGYLLKDETPEELVNAIKKINKGDIYLSSKITRAALGKGKQETVDKVQNSEECIGEISMREREILQMIAEGFRNKEIAEKIFISPFTVKKHISNTYHKLNVNSRIKAIEKAKNLNIIK
jgi:DNA-binding NarL/FixJ family response regulator